LGFRPDCRVLGIADIVRPRFLFRLLVLTRF
jgi:hypothetical protein